MKVTFTSPRHETRGVVASILKRCYADLLAADPARWNPEVSNWQDFDRDVFDHPDTVGSCIFLTRVDEAIVGLGSWDPRGAPEVGIVGHNCILPEFRGRGFGKAQIEEILRRLDARGIRLARTSTLAGEWHRPAQKMYLSCRFRETGRHPWHGDPHRIVIEYERDLSLREGGIAGFDQRSADPSGFLPGGHRR